jgi:hypothetical protein
MKQDDDTRWKTKKKLDYYCCVVGVVVGESTGEVGEYAPYEVGVFGE